MENRFFFAVRVKMTAKHIRWVDDLVAEVAQTSAAYCLAAANHRLVGANYRWWQQTIVWWEQTKIIRHKTIHLLAFVPYYLPAAFCEECCQSLRKS